MINNKTKRLVIMGMAIFGTVVLVAALFRARTTSSANANVSLSQAAIAQLKSIFAFA